MNRSVKWLNAAVAVVGFSGVVYVTACGVPTAPEEESVAEAQEAIGGLNEGCSELGFCQAGLACCIQHGPYFDSYRCRNLQNDVNNCNACGTVCPTRANATRTCTAGTCGFTCNAGWADCNGNAADGCETNLNTSTGNCGTCGHACSTNHGTASCSGGSCGITCSAGWGDCINGVSDGCETNLNGSSAAPGAHCGSCTTTCGAGSVCCAGHCDSDFTSWNCCGTPPDVCDTVGGEWCANLTPGGWQCYKP